jgi:hypothetical protein
MSMRQPRRRRVRLTQIGCSDGVFWRANVPYLELFGSTRKAALRAAARRLRSLAAECDRLSERGE